MASPKNWPYRLESDVEGQRAWLRIHTRFGEHHSLWAYSAFSTTSLQNRVWGCSTINDLIANIAKLHTTELGVIRVKRNLCLKTDDVVAWCKDKILNPNCSITRNGKNWYASIDGCTITVNAHSYTIITTHRANTRNSC